MKGLRYTYISSIIILGGATFGSLFSTEQNVYTIVSVISAFIVAFVLCFNLFSKMEKYIVYISDLEIVDGYCVDSYEYTKTIIATSDLDAIHQAQSIQNESTKINDIEYQGKSIFGIPDTPEYLDRFKKYF